jgi:hypothetical protein
MLKLMQLLTPNDTPEQTPREQQAVCKNTTTQQAPTNKNQYDDYPVVVEMKKENKPKAHPCTANPATYNEEGTESDSPNRQNLSVFSYPSQDANSIFKLLKLPTPPVSPDSLDVRDSVETSEEQHLGIRIAKQARQEPHSLSPKWNEKLISDVDLKTKGGKRISWSGMPAAVVTSSTQTGEPHNIAHGHVHDSQPVVEDDSKSKGEIAFERLAVQGRDWEIHSDDDEIDDGNSSSDSETHLSNQKNVICRSARSAHRGGAVTCLSTCRDGREPSSNPHTDTPASMQSKPPRSPPSPIKSILSKPSSQISVSCDTVSLTPKSAHASHRRTEFWASQRKDAHFTEESSDVWGLR